MGSTIDDRTTGAAFGDDGGGPARVAPPSLPSPLAVAALASLAAGLVHAAAAGSHAGQPTLPVLFALAAAAQVGWAAAVVWRPAPATVAAGVVVNGALVAVWALTRTVGWGAVDALAAPEAVGTQDLIAALLGGIAALAATATLATWLAPGWTTRRAVPVLAGVALLGLAIPGMAVEHDHDHADGHEHGDVVAGAADPAAADQLALAGTDGHEHDDGHGHADGHGHDDSPAEQAALPTGPVISLDDPRLTADQRAVAEDLIDRTRAAMARYTDVASVEAAGYVSIGDGLTGYEHFIHVGHIADPAILDPERVESIVFRVEPDGTTSLVSAMYILPPGQTMADVPDLAGDLTVWHDHQDLCWEGIRVVGRIDADGVCPRGEFRPTAPMLHVWLVEHECGPFAGIEGGGHGAGCGHDHGAPPSPTAPAAPSRESASG